MQSPNKPMPLPDGTYQVTVDRVSLTKTKHTGTVWMSWKLIVDDPQTDPPTVLWKRITIKKSALRQIKKDLYTCGLTIDKISLLPKNIHRLAGLKLEISKMKSGQYDNIYFNRCHNPIDYKSPAQEQSPDSVPRDLFGDPLPPPKLKKKPSIKKPELSAQIKQAPESEPVVIRSITEEQIKSFKDLRAEVCIKTESGQKIWLVPEYTGQDRNEVSAEHAAYYTMICSTFPGAKITDFVRTE